MHYLWLPDAFSPPLVSWPSGSSVQQLFLCTFERFFTFFCHSCNCERVCERVCVNDSNMNVTSQIFTVRWPRLSLLIQSSVPVFVTCRRQDTPVVLSLVYKATAAIPGCECVCVCVCLEVWVCACMCASSSLRSAFTATCTFWTLHPKCLEHSDCRGSTT